MTRYKRRPVEVEAMRYQTGDACNCFELAAWYDPDEDPRVLASAHGPGEECPDLPWYVSTPLGMVHANAGDWIVRDADGGLWVWDPDLFAAEFEAV